MQNQTSGEHLSSASLEGRSYYKKATTEVEIRSLQAIGLVCTKGVSPCGQLMVSSCLHGRHKGGRQGKRSNVFSFATSTTTPPAAIVVSGHNTRQNIKGVLGH